MYHFNGIPLEPLDIIIVQCWGIFQHPIIYLGNNQFIDNTLERGVSMVSFDELRFRNVINVARMPHEPQKTEKRINKALSLIGKPYSFLNYNCEHFLFDVFDKNVPTTQLNKIIEIIDKT